MTTVRAILVVVGARRRAWLKTVLPILTISDGLKDLRGHDLGGNNVRILQLQPRCQLRVGDRQQQHNEHEDVGDDDRVEGVAKALAAVGLREAAHRHVGAVRRAAVLVVLDRVAPQGDGDEAEGEGGRGAGRDAVHELLALGHEAAREDDEDEDGEREEAAERGEGGDGAEAILDALGRDAARGRGERGPEDADAVLARLAEVDGGQREGERAIRGLEPGFGAEADEVEEETEEGKNHD